MSERTGRLLLFENGAVLGVFSSCARTGRAAGRHPKQAMQKMQQFSGAIVLEPSGTCFTHVQQDGTCNRQISEYCKVDLLPQLESVTTFRNLYSLRPYISERLHVDTTSCVSIGPRASSGNPADGVERRQRRRTSRLAYWPKIGCGDPRHCIVHPDGKVEVRALGGNARLTLSVLRTSAEVDFATSVESSIARSSTNVDGGKENGCGNDRGHRPRTNNNGGRGSSSAGRVWITQRFLVACAPAAFAHPLAVALSMGISSANGQHGQGHQVGVDTGVLGEEGVNGGGPVSLELPMPAYRPDHCRWDTVRASWSPLDRPDEPFYYCDEQQHRVRVGDDARSQSTTAHVAPSRSLLAVDVLQLGAGQGFTGTLAVVVESNGDCTYRIMERPDDGGDFSDVAGARTMKVDVHVAVHADGTEIFLEGDFVRVVRPPNSSNVRPRERLLHVSATSTFCFRVSSLANRYSSTGTASASNSNTTPTATTISPGGSLGTTSSGIGHICSTPAPAVAESTMGNTGAEFSLGNITTHAQAFRQQYTTWRRYRPCHVSSPVRAFAHLGSLVSPLGYAGGGLASGAKHHSAVTTSAPPGDHHGFYTGTTLKQSSCVSADVVERAERGGASFVLFADGRARGAFADRTIVTLPGGTEVSRPESGRGKGSGAEGLTIADPNVFARKTQPKDGRSYHYSHGDKYRDITDVTVDYSSSSSIECILPDGNVVHLSISKALFQSRRDSDIHNSNALDGGAQVETINRVIGYNTGRSDAAPAAADAAAVSRSGRQAAGRSKFSVAAGRTESDEKSSINTFLKPYIFAVRRFAAWAAADPDERRSATTRSNVNRLASLVEAEKNRRFVTLRSLQYTATRSDADASSASRAKHSKVLGGMWAEGGHIGGRHGGGSAGASDVGVFEAGERNEIVHRVLAANREALLGRDASRSVEFLKGLR